ncbi:hypothetical protein [Methylomonas sp. MgM2]
MIARIVFLILFWGWDSAVAVIGGGDRIDLVPLPNEFCNSDSIRKQNELLKKFPEDEGIIKIYALYIGLCRLVDDGKISEYTANILWSEQRNKLINERKGAR